MPQKIDFQPLPNQIDFTPDYQDEPSKANQLLNTWREFDKPIIDFTPATNAWGDYFEKKTPKAVGSAMLDLMPGSSLIRAATRAPETRTIGNSILDLIPFGNTIANAMGRDPNQEGMDPRYFFGGSARGVGDVASSLTTPSNLVATAATLGAGGLARAGIGTGVRALTNVSRLAMAPTALSGLGHVAEEVTSGEPWDLEKLKRTGQGGLELAMGGLGVMQHVPNVRTPLLGSHDVPLPPSPQPRLPGMENIDFNQGVHPPSSFDVPGQLEPPQPQLPFQENIPFEKTVPSPFEYEGTPRPTPFQVPGPPPTFEQSMRGTDMSQFRNVPPTPEIPPVEPSASLGDIIDMPTDPHELQMRKNEGYVTDPNRRGPNGQLQMVKGGATQPTATPKTQVELPHELKGAKPRYKNYELEFHNDLEKALYIIAKETPSKRDADYLAFVMQHLDLDEAGARELGRDVRKEVGAQVKGQPEGVVQLDQMYDFAVPGEESTKLPESWQALHEDAPVPVAPADVTPSLIARMKAAGKELIGKDAQGNSLFQRLKGGSAGTFDPAEMFRNVGRLVRGEPMGAPAEVRQQSQLENISNAPREDFNPQEMRIPNVREGNTGLENVAMGGADPRVLDVMGSSLYSRERPVTTIKELLQNAFDEHKELGIKEPVRVYIDQNAPNPLGGNNGRSITVRDRGRGLDSEQIYTVLTDLGKTGKAGVESASGGFGFAKAAPFLGGEYSKVTSVVDTPQGRMRYTFEGTPNQFKNQIRGVALNEELVGSDVPTGLEVHTFYDKDISGFYAASEWAKNMTERSPSVKGGILLAEDYGASPVQVRRWLDETSQNPIDLNKEYNYGKSTAKEYMSQSIPTMQDTINVPGSKINIHYDIEPGVETQQAAVHLANKGMYQGTDKISYGESTANVPRSIVADINATVEEGHADYPFSANREQINDKVTTAINKWVKDNIVTGVTRKRVAAIQRKYDAIQPIDSPVSNHNMDFYDDGNRFTPEELDVLRSHPKLNQALDILEQVHSKMMEVVDSLGWKPLDYSATWKLPSERLKKFGLLFQGSTPEGTTLGIHVPRPDDLNNSSILINLFEQLNLAMEHDTPIDKLTTSLFTTLAHEQAHIPGGSHDKGFAYRDAQLRSKLGEGKTVDLLNALGEVFDDGKGNISPEISELLSIYNESRGRQASGDDALLATGISSQRRPNTYGGTEGNIERAGTGETESQTLGQGLFRRLLTEETGTRQVGGVVDRLNELKSRRLSLAGEGGEGKIGGGDKGISLGREAYNFPRGVTTTADLSAPLRQGLPLILNKEWWTSWRQMVKSFGSEGAYQKTLNDLKSRKMFQREVDVKTGKERPSYAERAGIKLMDLSVDRLNTAEENIASNWVETGGFLGSDILGKETGLQRAYQKSAGRFARASNRAYTSYLNQLRADSFESLIKDAYKQFEAGGPGVTNPYTDLKFAKEIGDFVNTATGRGPMRTQLPYARIEATEGGGRTLKTGIKEYSLEQHARLATNLLFSPRLIASRVRMLNPMTYSMASPFVRRQYLKALLGVGTAWGTVATLGKLAGADVSTDTDSADFGKIRIGNTRLDPAAGFQQYVVAASRLYNGTYTSSATQQSHEAGAGFQGETQKDIGERFLANKLHPVIKFAYDLLDASEYQPFQVGDRTAQMFVPLIVGDVVDLAKQDPSLLPWMAPLVASGMGTQTYGKGEATSKFIPPESDLTITKGFGINKLMPWNWIQ